jgi:hypothetical protein
MGASWVRLGAPWYAVQPQPHGLNQTELSELDQVVADAAAVGLRVLFTGDQAPGWAGGGSATASRPAAYGSYMGALAEHFRGHGPHGVSPAYEIMNEPNGQQPDGQTWATPTNYAQAACAAYHAIKSHDPSAIIAVGSLDVSDWEPWLRAAFRAGLGGCFDVLSAHPYSGLDVLDEIRAVANDERSPNASIWVTEFGVSTCANTFESCVGESEQARMLVQRLELLGQSYPWVPVAIVYEAQDEPEASGRAAERGFGLFAKGASGVMAKPAVTAIRALYTPRATATPK